MTKLEYEYIFFSSSISIVHKKCYLFIHVCMYGCCICVCVNERACIHTCIHTNIHTCVHTYVYVYMYIQLCLFLYLYQSHRIKYSCVTFVNLFFLMCFFFLIWITYSALSSCKHIVGCGNVFFFSQKEPHRRMAYTIILWIYVHYLYMYTYLLLFFLLQIHV